jgi:hypothetical protein
LDTQFGQLRGASYSNVYPTAKTINLSSAATCWCVMLWLSIATTARDNGCIGSIVTDLRAWRALIVVLLERPCGCARERWRAPRETSLVTLM